MQPDLRPDDWDNAAMVAAIVVLALCLCALFYVALRNAIKDKRAKRLPPPSTLCNRDYHRERYIR